MAKNIEKMKMPCPCIFTSSSGGSVVSVKMLRAVEGTKPGEAVPLGKAGFMEAKRVTSGMIAGDGAFSGFAGVLLQL